jgi:hypothetical protein
VTIDTLRRLQAYDSGGRARAMVSIVLAFASAKAGEVSQADIDTASSWLISDVE